MISGSLHAFEHWLLNYRRVWHGSIVSSFLMPVLFLTGIGFGVGAYVDSDGALGGVPYAAFVAPGLLVSAAFQVTAGETTWPVYGALRWGKQYRAMQTSPLTPGQILAGHLMYAMLRGLVAAAVFLAVLAAFGLADSARALLGLVPALAACFAAGGWVYAYAVRVKNETALTMVHRFGIVPLTALSGVFFPLTQLPVGLQYAGWVSPLWHAAELSRWATAGVAPAWNWPTHLGYLLILGVLGCWAAERQLRRRLTV